MNRDLIKRLQAPGWIYRDLSGKQWVDDAPMMAAAALAEAQATIARQQVMLDRALESNGDMQAQIARLRGALTDIKDIYWGSGEADIAKAITDTTAPEP